MQKPMRILMLAILTTIVFVSCSKDDTPSASQKEIQLTKRSWKITSLTTKKVNAPNEDSSIIKPCNADDILLFRSDRRFLFKDSTLICDSTLFQYDQGTWAFNSGETSLLLDGQKRDQKWNIVSFNDSLLKVTWFDSTSSEHKLLKTIVFSNK